MKLKGKKNIIKILIDALLLVCVYELLLGFINSPMPLNMNFNLVHYIVISTVLAFLLAVVYFLFTKTEKRAQSIVSFLVGDTVVSLCLMFLLFILRITFKINIFPIRELNNADGITMIIVSAVFFSFSFLFKILSSLLLIIKNKRKNKIEQSITADSAT